MLASSHFWLACIDTCFTNDYILSQADSFHDHKSHLGALKDIYIERLHTLEQLRDVTPPADPPPTIIRREQQVHN